MYRTNMRSVDSNNMAADAQRSGLEAGLLLRSASERGRLQDVRRMLKAGAPILRDSNGLNALHKASKHGHTSTVKLLLSTRRFNPNQTDKYGWTPLHWAAWNGHVTATQVLAESNRCNLNIVDKSGSNVLHCASLNGHTDVIRVLVQASCDPNLQRQGDGWSPLHLASWNGYSDAARELLASKCRINERTTAEGMGALHLAAAKGYSDIAQLLLNSGIAPDMQDNDGNTALHEAARWSHPATVKILVDSFCRLSVRNKSGDTPMDIARRENHTEVVAELSSFGTTTTTATTARVFEENFSHEELKKLLFHSHGDKSKWSLEVGLPEKKAWLPEKKAGIPEKKAWLSSGADTMTFDVERTWQEQLAEAQGNVRARYGSRVTEVAAEERRRNTMDAVIIEKQCTAAVKGTRSRGARGRVHKATPHRSPSAPEPQNFTFVVHPPVPPCGSNRPDSF